jgi:hypothetical protein
MHTQRKRFVKVILKAPFLRLREGKWETGKQWDIYRSGVDERSSPSTWCWLKTAIRTLGDRKTVPEEGSNSPDINFSRVDFPIPFGPTTVKCNTVSPLCKVFRSRKVRTKTTQFKHHHGEELSPVQFVTTALYIRKQSVKDINNNDN